MTARLLLCLLFVSAAARAERSWIFERGQSLVTAEVGPRKARLSAVSSGLAGRLNENDQGELLAEVRIPLASFDAGDKRRNEKVRETAAPARFPEIVFQGKAPAAEDGATVLTGTLTFHGEARPFQIPLKLVRAGPMLYGHATLALHLREFGVPVPDGLDDEVRIEVDAGLRPDNQKVASRG